METTNLKILTTCVIITGMHRSGTSLFASYLQACGLNIGNDLIGPQKDNINGYFEDRDFVDFHQKVINKNKNNIFLTKDISFKYEDLIRATKIIRNKNEYSLWGWKDPRTTLFLNFWKALLPQSFYILLYRHPFEVINSLLRRRTDAIVKINPLVSAKGWIIYNTKILEFHKNNRDRVMLLNINDVINSKGYTLINVLKSKFNINLSKKHFNSVFNSKIFSTSKFFVAIPTFVYLIYKSKLMKLYYQLENQKTKIIF